MARPKSRAESILSSAEPYLGTKEAAALLGVSVSTIQKMVESGKLQAWRTQGGHRRIAQAQLQSLMPPVKAGSGASLRKSLSILFVEDNAVMVRAYARIVKQWGEQVDVSFAGDSASALLRIAQQHPDLVVTDLDMAPFDGFHLIRTLRASSELADTRILVVTGLSSEQIAARGGLDAATLCYRKPLSFERFGGYIDARLKDLKLRS